MPPPLGCLLKILASRDLCLFSFLGSNAKLASLPDAGEDGSESSLLKFLLLILLLSTWPALQWHSAQNRSPASDPHAESMPEVPTPLSPLHCLRVHEQPMKLVGMRRGVSEKEPATVCWSIRTLP